ncbi:PREDICTED: uncharacterized protein LOC104825227 isoform X2 [Tarenaya hassleriana]|uniref:uncharacterized protein LOC104825227 isoform X2 n=1 Tax=Tarenaya hassleriana TaxID=28532 RepID=UPI0008FD8C38|nr:PREDICTED: uncharacterized protein LOC104825227 isoform X2 [Tarenaya hassleriana]
MWDSFLVNHGERRTEMEARERNGRRPQFAIEESGRLLLRASSRGEGQFGVRVCFGSLSLWLSSSTTMSLLAKLSVRNGLLGVGQNKECGGKGFVRRKGHQLQPVRSEEGRDGQEPSLGIVKGAADDRIVEGMGGSNERE